MNSDVLNLIIQYAQIAEAVAVILSLIYVAIQIRLNTKATQSATYQNIISGMAGIEARISENEELAKIYKKGCDATTELSDVERIRFTELISSMINFYENLFYQYQKGVLESEMWEGWSNGLFNFLRKPGVKNWWDKYNNLFSKSFRDYIAMHESRV